MYYTSLAHFIHIITLSISKKEKSLLFSSKNLMRALKSAREKEKEILITFVFTAQRPVALVMHHPHSITKYLPIYRRIRDIIADQAMESSPKSSEVALCLIID